MKGFKRLFFGAIISMMALPAFQAAFHLIPERTLRGAFIKEEFPELTKGSWFDGTYQDKFNNVLESSIGFHKTLVRINNEIDYRLFRKANAEGVIIGNNRNLYEYDYIRSLAGIDYMGRQYMEHKLSRFKFLQEHLKETKDIDLILVLEPGKASFFPEDIPEKYLKNVKDSTNYLLIKALIKERQLNCLDLIQYFNSLKNNSPYPLFTKNGTHWSVYGAVLASDTLIGYIEDLRDIHMGPLHWDTVEFSRIPRDTDNDVETAMNLLLALPQQTYAYPIIRYDTVNQYDKPLVLTVGDSYYWNIFNLRVPKYLFGNEAFWYFNHEIYPDFYVQAKYVKDVNIRYEVEKNEVVMIVLTERNHFNIDWRFIDMLYEAYVPGEYIDPVYSRISRMILHPPWFNEMIEHSQTSGEPLGNILWREAKYQLYLDDKFEYMLRYGQEYLEGVIRDDSAWLDQVRQKATAKGISVEEMVTMDAIYMFNLNYPEISQIYTGIRDQYEEIAKNAVLSDSLLSIVKKYQLSDETARFGLACNLYREQRLQQIKRSILSDYNWSEHVEAKASAKGVTFEEMLELDANWVYDEEVRKARENASL